MGTLGSHSPLLTSERMIFVPEIEAFGGAERSCLALSKWLHARQVNHSFLLYKDHVNLSTFADHPLILVELNPEMRFLRKIESLRAFVSRSNLKGPQLLASGIQAALHAGLVGIKGFHTLMHDTPSLVGQGSTDRSVQRAVRSRISNWAIGRGLRSGGNTIVTSEYLKKECREAFSVEASIVRMGGMTDRRSFRLRPVRDRLRMLSVSRVEPSKRIDWILRALAKIESEDNLSSRIQWQFDVVGTGSSLECLRELNRELGLSGRVNFHGFLNDEDLTRMYADANLFLVPARQGYGLPVIEALQRGIPVLLHRESGVSDILLETPWATVMRGDETSMCDSLRSALKSVMNGAHLRVDLPHLPTEDEWAGEIARLCNWM